MLINRPEARDICERLSALEEQNKTLTSTMNEIDQNTKEMITTFNAFKGGFSVLEQLGRLAKPVGYIALAVSATITVIIAFRDALFK